MTVPQIKQTPLWKGGLFMTYKQIEASRELRLWIGQVIVPAIGVSLTVLANPEVRSYVSNKIEKTKTKFQKNKNGAL